MTEPGPAGPRCWVNTVSLDHVQGAMEGGFTQSDHGSDRRVRQLGVGDRMVFYSPRTEMRGGDALQHFTALAVVTGRQPYQVEVSEDFRPWRREVRFLDVHPVAARPLVPQLSFITDPSHWGLPFRRGLFTIPAADLDVIAAAMGAAPG